MNSKELIGNVKESFKTEPKGLDYKSYYAGWLKGRFELIHRKDTICPLCEGKLKFKFILRYFKCEKCKEVFTD